MGLKLNCQKWANWSCQTSRENGGRDLLELEQVCQALGVRPKVLVERFEKDRVSHNTALR